jgi:hypothetical protein
LRRSGQVIRLGIRRRAQNFRMGIPIWRGRRIDAASLLRSGRSVRGHRLAQVGSGDADWGRLAVGRRKFGSGKLLDLFVGPERRPDGRRRVVSGGGPSPRVGGWRPANRAILAARSAGHRPICAFRFLDRHQLSFVNSRVDSTLDIKSFASAGETNPFCDESILDTWFDFRSRRG